MPDLMLPGQPPPPLFFPPFPNEEKMRRGRLNAEAPLGLLGETHSVGRRTSCSLSPLMYAHTIRSKRQPSLQNPKRTNMFLVQIHIARTIGHLLRNSSTWTWI